MPVNGRVAFEPAKGLAGPRSRLRQLGVIGRIIFKTHGLRGHGSLNRGVIENKFEKGVHGREGLLGVSDPSVDFLEPGNLRRARDAAYRSSSKNTVKIVLESFFNVCSLLKSDIGCRKHVPIG